MPVGISSVGNPTKIERIVFWSVLIGAILILASGIASSVLASSEGPGYSFSRSALTLLLILGSIGAVLIMLTIIPKYSSPHLTRERASKLTAIISIIALPLVLLLGEVFENGAGFAPIVGSIVGLSAQIGAISCFVGGLMAFFSNAVPKNVPTKTNWFRVAIGVVLGTFIGCLLEFLSLVGVIGVIGEFLFLFAGIIGALIAYWIANGSMKLRVISAIAALSLTLLFLFFVLFHPPIAPDGANLGTSCIGQPGFSCSSPTIDHNGLLSFSLGYGTGYPAYNAKLACVYASNSVASNNYAYSEFVANGTLNSGAIIQVTNLQCYPAVGSTSDMLSPIGTEFVGTLWMEYSTTNNQFNSSSLQFTKVATIAVKSSS